MLVMFIIQVSLTIVGLLAQSSMQSLVVRMDSAFMHRQFFRIMTMLDGMAFLSAA